MSGNAVHGSGGIGFIGLLTIVFVIAKIGGWVDWSWWVVFLPVILAGAAGLFLVCVAVAIYLINDR